jgi:hypothetical protein
MWQKVLIAVAAIWAVVAPLHGLFWALGLLVLADMVMGIWRAVKQKRKVRPSKAIRQTLGKAASYLIMLLAGFAVDYLYGDHTTTVYVARGFALGIGIAEATSLAENFQAITGIDLVKLIRERFKPPASDKDANE